MESLRVWPPAPIGNVRVTEEAIDLGGYLVPKGTTILAPIHAIHMQDEYFPDAERFIPERWLDPDAGKGAAASKNLMQQLTSLDIRFVIACS